MKLTDFMKHTGFQGNGGDGIGIAIIDSGVESIQDNIVYGYNSITGKQDVFDDTLSGENKHGQNIYDIINTISPNANYYIFKAFNGKGMSTSLYVYEALIRCRDIEGIDIICMSFSSLREMNKVTLRALNECIDENKLVFTAMGNDNSSTITYPSGVSGVYPVGGLDDSFERKSERSNYGSRLKFVAPSERLELPNGRIVDGTSYANAIVVGQIADIMGVEHIYREDFNYTDIIQNHCKLDNIRADLAYGVLYKNK